jgi:hypothetical protein
VFPIIRNLFAATPARPTQPARLGRLGCEALEARDCPAVITTQALSGGGWGLFISPNGANTADTVTVRENHATNTLQVIHNNSLGQTVTQTLNTAVNNGLRLVDATLGAGDDTFRYELDGSDYTDGKLIDVDLGNAGTATGDRATVILNDSNVNPNGVTAAVIRSTRAQFQFGGGTGTQNVTMQVGGIDGGTQLTELFVNATLGDGNDVFLSNHTGDQLGQTYVNLNVFGGLGDDSLRTLATADVDIQQFGRLIVQLDGGAGNDFLESRYDGELDGILHFSLRGGADNDTIRASAVKDAGSTGFIQGGILGDAGTDDVTYTGPLDGLTVNS